MVGSSRLDYDLATPALPERGQAVEFLFDDHVWYKGEVSAFDNDAGKIIFVVGQTSELPIGGPDVFFLPASHNQWRSSAESSLRGVLLEAQLLLFLLGTCGRILNQVCSKQTGIIPYQLLSRIQEAGCRPHQCRFFMICMQS